MKFIIQTAFAFLVLSLSFSISNAQNYVPRIAQCVAIENGETIVNGPCMFEATDEEGSFKFQTDGMEYWGSFTVDNQSGVIIWNGESFASHAHNIQRNLRRYDACWVNEASLFCFW
ncbi:hypothetical protein [Pseudosulfitobacter sp. SM2401]|uniref:hypothetical protein n=1 Tax=Pseudosulfitobacter sp. SM2401 TaxID=3350098 RepID=UPI0036F43D16